MTRRTLVSISKMTWDDWDRPRKARISFLGKVSIGSAGSAQASPFLKLWNRLGTT